MEGEERGWVGGGIGGGGEEGGEGGERKLLGRCFPEHKSLPDYTSTERAYRAIPCMLMATQHAC